MAILKIKDKGVWKEIQAIKGDTGHDVYVGDKSKAPSEAKLIIEPVKGTATGTDIQVTDSANDRVSKLVLDGKSTQETRSGKNLLNYIDNLISNANGLTNTINPDGSITTTGKPARNYVTIIKSIAMTDLLEDKQVYTISNEKPGKIYVQVNAMKNDGTYRYYNSYNGKTSFTVDKSLYKSYTVVIQTTTMSTWGDSSLTITNKYMLCKGTDTVFEKYGASPSPDYPSEIENVKGRNLLPNLLAQGSWNTTSALTRVANYSNIYLKAGTYTFSSNIDITKYKVWLGTGKVKFPQPDWSNVKGIQDWSQIREKTFTTTTDSYFLVMYSKVDGSNITPDELNGLEQQLEKGPVATRYVPYGNIQIVETGKNLFDKNSAETQIGYFTSTGTLNGGGGSTVTTTYTKIVPNNDMTISGIQLEWLCFYDKNKNFVERIAGGALTSNTFNKNASYIRIQAATSAFDLEKIQLEKGSTATDYEPYTEEVVNIDLKGNELTKYDKLIIKDGKATIQKKFRNLSLPIKDMNNFEDYPGWQPQPELLKDYPNKNGSFDSVPISYMTNISNSGFRVSLNTVGSNGVIFLNKSVYGLTQTQWKEKYPDLVFDLIYELAEPYEIDLGEVSTLTTYEGTSNLTNSEDTNMSIEYVTNKTNLYYQNNGNIIKMNEGS